MKLSNKAAKLLGEQFARCLHAQGNNPVARGGVIDAKNDVLSLIVPYSTSVLIDQSYRAALDILEPLQQGAKW
jgi:tagatose-1,6-bisphosphate aldolase